VRSGRTFTLFASQASRTKNFIRGINVDHTIMEFFYFIRRKVVNLYQAEDVRLGNYLAALEALDSGITTVFDHCQNIITPEFADAAVEGLRSAGPRPKRPGQPTSSHKALRWRRGRWCAGWKMVKRENSR
jgi:hypothetical protein